MKNENFESGELKGLKNEINRIDCSLKKIVLLKRSLLLITKIGLVSLVLGLCIEGCQAKPKKPKFEKAKTYRDA